MTDMIRSADPVTGSVVDVGWFLPDGITKDPAFPYSNEVGDLTFPYAYVIPMAADMQQNPPAAVKFVNQARLYGAEVEKATASVRRRRSRPTRPAPTSSRRPSRSARSSTTCCGTARMSARSTA